MSPAVDGNGTLSSRNGVQGSSKNYSSVRIVRILIVSVTIAGSLCSLALLTHMVSTDEMNHDFDLALTHIHSLTKEFDNSASSTAPNGREGPVGSVSIAENKAAPPPMQSNQTVPVDALPLGLRGVLERATKYQKLCNELNQTQTLDEVSSNVTDLPNFGIIDALSSYKPTAEARLWSQCTIPPPTECAEKRFTVVFLAYNPERVSHMSRIIGRMTNTDSGEWTDLVEEVVVVWNGERSLTETKQGANLDKMTRERKVRIVYPLKQGFPNDLMNRYNPNVIQVKTKALLYYDDDGPFYSKKAVQAGFELWKRNSNAQIGAMARRLDVGPRQVAEKQSLFEGLSDKHFVSHCRACGDTVFYNYYVFANFGANMVLPSGSFLHSDYLCFLWHPALEEIRQFVRDDAVHPDDATVSIIVSQVGGRAPKVYSRRINEKKDTTQERRLGQITSTSRDSVSINITRVAVAEEGRRDPKRRKLLWEQEGWGGMRNSAVNSLVSYFGSLNSGSLGWCYGTEFHKVTRKGDNVCDPDMAAEGMLTWMTDKHEPRDLCP